MDKAERLLGAVLLVYSALYIMQAVFSPLYADALDPSEVWTVMNYCTAVGILASGGVVWRWLRRGGVNSAGERIERFAAVSATVALTIWFFSNWFRLLTMAEGELTSEADNVIWALVSVVNPLVLGTAGLHLWRTGKGR